jgi:hypothetical protein
MAVAGVLGVLLVGCATVEVTETRVVMGRVTDESGQPVANSPVLIVGRTLQLVTSRMEYEERSRGEVRGLTDADGRYRIEFVPGKVGNDFTLFFYDKTGFHGVKYRRPEPHDITSRLGSDRVLIIDEVLKFQVAWPEVQRQIAFYGRDSDRAQVLRKHGLPEKRETSGTGDTAFEVWWYYTDGVSYWFAGEKLTRTQEFTPLPGVKPAK